MTDETVMLKGKTVRYRPPKSWMDGADGASCVVYTEPALSPEGHWEVLVLPEGSAQLRAVHAFHLEIIGD